MWLWARLSSPPLLCVCVSNWHLLLMSTCWRLQDSLSCYKPIRKFPEKMFVRNISWKSWLSLSYQKYERDLLTRDINFLVKYFKLFWPLKCFTIPIKVRSGCYCRINYFCLPDIDTFIFVPNITLSTSVFESLISFKYHEWHFYKKKFNRSIYPTYKNLKTVSFSLAALSKFSVSCCYAMSMKCSQNILMAWCLVSECSEYKSQKNYLDQKV